MAALPFRLLWKSLATASLLAAFAKAQNCSCTGLDYTDGGSYLIDGSSQLPFTFHSIFSSCQDGYITPILLDAGGTEFNCSEIETQPDDSQQTSECNITYSQMQTGAYTIILQSTDFEFASQRQFKVTVGNQATVVVTVTPTEYVGVTYTPEATTETVSHVETQTDIEDPETVTSYCDVATQTVFNYIPGPTSVFSTVIERWMTNGFVTNYYQTTVAVEAYCHWPSTWVSPTQDRPPPPTATSRPTICDGCRPWYTSGSWAYTRPPPTTTPRNRPTRTRTTSNSPTWSPPRSTPNPPPTYSPPKSLPPTSTPIKRPPPTSSPPPSPPGSSYTSCRGQGPCGNDPTSSRGGGGTPGRPTTTPPRSSPPPSSTHHDTPPPSSTPRQPPPSSTHRDPPPSSTPRQSPPSSTRRDPPPPSSTHHDNPPPTSTPRQPPPSSTHRDSPPSSSTRHENPPPTSTPRNNPPPSSTSRRNPPPTTAPREPARPTSNPPKPTSQPNHNNGGGGQSKPPSAKPAPPVTHAPAPAPVHSNPPSQPGRGGGGGGAGGGGRGGKPETADSDGDDASTAIARRALMKLNDVTSTLVETTYTFTATSTSTVPAPTVTEDDFYIVTTTFYPPAQTVCDDNDVPTVTYYLQGPPQTEYHVDYVTYNTWATIWVGQTQYSTHSDRDAMTQCWQGGGRYGS